MSYRVKAHSAKAPSQPPEYRLVADSEVTLKDRTVRSQKPEEHYQITPKRVIRSLDNTVPLDEEFAALTLISPNKTQSKHPSLDSSFGSDNSEWQKYSESVFESPITTATAYDLGTLKKTEAFTSVTYTDSLLPSAPLPTDTASATATVTTSLSTPITPSSDTVTVSATATETVSVTATPSSDVTVIPPTTASASVVTASLDAPTTSSIAGLPVTTDAGAPSLSVTYTDVPLSIIPTVAPVLSAEHLAHAADVAVSESVDEDTDSEQETEMEKLNPPHFRGVTSENAETWLRTFNNYCTYKEYGPERSKALFKVLLTDSAAVWLDSLDDTTLNDWDALKMPSQLDTLRPSSLSINTPVSYLIKSRIRKLLWMISAPTCGDWPSRWGRTNKCCVLQC